jgi:hypothetical protein
VRKLLQIREKLAREKLKDPLFLRYLSRMFRVAGVLEEGEFTVRAH